MNVPLQYFLNQGPLTFLAALLNRLKRTPSLETLLATPLSFYLDLSQWNQQYPFILITNYSDVLPGVTADDQFVRLTVCCYALDMTSAFQISSALTATLDSPNINANSLGLGNFAWRFGHTTGVMRNSRKANRTPYMSKGGQLVYEVSIDYEFWYTTTM